MSNDFNEQPSGPGRKEYKFLWMRFKRAEKRDIYQTLYGFITVIIAVGLAILFPQENCTCEDQVTDLRLETLARQGNRQVIHYQQQRESVIICAAKREELIKRLKEQEKHRSEKEIKPN
ncbi:hypothetical protein [Pedobacter psychrodurus]|uniref:hypothetical protein n=1 Tax=Pedobacter psychrodurus TaxID=2530456 RepID=UPI00292F42D8|nr:hypothetical protein [Pedobacter psychrodurus]